MPEKELETKHPHVGLILQQLLQNCSTNTHITDNIHAINPRFLVYPALDQSIGQED